MTYPALVFVKGKSFYSKAIEFGQRRRFGKPWSAYSHVAILINDHQAIEALGTGVVLSEIATWTDERAVVPIVASAEDRAEMLAFLRACLGREYSWATIFTTALHLITAAKVSISVDAENICSGLAAEMLTRGTWVFDNPADVTPAELAQLFRVS